MSMTFRILLVVALVAGIGLLFTFERPPVDVVQTGYRGVAMEQVYNPRTVAAQVAQNQLPAPIDPVDQDGPKAGEVYQNVKVLGDLPEAQFLRLMTAITEWVSPEQGCAYCHAEGEDFSSDSLYTKVVSRRMLQMTQTINVDWEAHVGQVGVTCYTCHRGQPVPTGIWFANPGQRTASGGMAGWHNGQNQPSKAANLSSLPVDPFTTFLQNPEKSIRVIGNTALPTGNTTSIQQTEFTYSLMAHMSESLGVNCTFCHNSRAFASWEQSPPQRVTAWHGIQMVRQLNADYLVPLQSTYPDFRLGPTGDAPKANCETCHKGIFRPLYGQGMLETYPELDRKGAPGSAALAPSAGTSAPQ